MGEVAKKQQHDCGKVKVLRLQELMGEMLDQTEGVSINSSETEEVLESWLDVLERAALELTETKAWTSRVESDVADVRTVMANGSAKTEEVRAEVVGLKAEFSDCGPEMKKDMVKLNRRSAQ
jgi:hypothetical protein